MKITRAMTDTLFAGLGAVDVERAARGRSKPFYRTVPADSIQLDKTNATMRGNLDQIVVSRYLLDRRKSLYDSMKRRSGVARLGWGQQ